MKVCKTATEALNLLWEEKFFKVWRKSSDISNHLDKNDHHFSDAELGMALKRAKFLTRKGKRGSFEYIQKHPYVGDIKVGGIKGERNQRHK